MSEKILQTETMKDYEDQFDNANPWNRLVDYMEKKTILPVKVEGIVNGGAIAVVEEIRGFIPASQLSLSYTENLEEFLLQDIEVRVIEADQANNRLVLSAKSILKEKQKRELAKTLNNVVVGSILKGTVESLQNYGAFVRLENGLSGLVHISQISHTRIKSPSDILKAGEEIDVKVIGVNDGKISLSIKALSESEEEVIEVVDIPESEDIGTSLGSLFKNIKL